ncbi:MAG TPA: hypothetical protein VGH67_15040 [Solirubrobacteraceae bacterium]|jgi:hypothetical protein
MTRSARPRDGQEPTRKRRALRRFASHIRGNAVGYLALFTALGGTSYAAVTLAPNSVKSKALANGAVTSAKLARNSVSSANVRNHSLLTSDFSSSAIKALGGVSGKDGSSGSNGNNGNRGPAGPTGPAGQDGNASVVSSARQSGGVTAPHGASTSVPLTGASWTQGPSDVDLVTGSMDVSIPATCTGSFGNSLVVSVDGVPNTFAVAPTAPASTTQTVPFEVSELMEPGAAKQHTITAALANSCTKSGEDYGINNVKIDVVNFH